MKRIPLLLALLMVSSCRRSSATGFEGPRAASVTWGTVNEGQCVNRMDLSTSRHVDSHGADSAERNDEGHDTSSSRKKAPSDDSDRLAQVALLEDVVMYRLCEARRNDDIGSEEYRDRVALVSGTIQAYLMEELALHKLATLQVTELQRLRESTEQTQRKYLAARQKCMDEMPKWLETIADYSTCSSCDCQPASRDECNQRQSGRPIPGRAPRDCKPYCDAIQHMKDTPGCFNAEVAEGK